MKRNEKNKMADMPMRQLVLNISLPLMVSLLVQSLYNIVDSIFVAKIGEDALTAISVAYPVQLLMIAVGVGTGVGVNALLSKNLGAQNETLVQKTAATGVMLACISSSVFVVLGICFSGMFARLFSDHAQIRTYATQYLSICMIISIGSFLATMFQRFLQATGDSFLSMISLIAGAVTNIVLDPLLIFGIAGFPRMEVVGAAVATVIGQCVSAIVGIFLNIHLNPKVKVRMKGFRFDASIVMQIYQVGLPTIVTQAVGSIMVTMVNAILMPVSSTAIAFFGIYYKLQNFLFMPMNGLGQAVIPIIGFNYGAKNNRRIMDAIKVVLPMGCGIGVAGMVLFMAFPTGFLRMFSASGEMLSLGVPALRIISVTFSIAAITMLLGYSMSGLGNGMVNMAGTIFRQLFPLIPLMAIVMHFFSIETVWYCMWISEICAAIFAVIAARHILRKKGINRT